MMMSLNFEILILDKDEINRLEESKNQEPHLSAKSP